METGAEAVLVDLEEPPQPLAEEEDHARIAVDERHHPVAP
jgi:hypothetical protein